MSTNHTYLQAIRDCISCGDEVSPRGNKTYEILGHSVTFDMNSPIITIPERDLDYNFMAAEAHWILSGESILNSYVRKNLVKYSDNGISMAGAYGPPFVQQKGWIISKLAEDPDTRQAVCQIWHRMPVPSKDISCTVAMQWLIRSGKLHCQVFMRSQDVWLGLPYDLFSFTMMSAYIASALETKVELGNLTIHAGSRHLYDRNLEAAGDLCVDGECGGNIVISTHKILTPGVIMNTLGVIMNAPNVIALDTIKEELCQ